LVKYSPDATQLWNRQWGTSGSDIAWAVVTDSTGRINIAGSTTGSLSVTNQGGQDAFVAQYDSHGTRLWDRQLGSPGDEWAYGVAADGDDNVLITGTNTSPLYDNYVGGYDIFLAKFDGNNGNRQWIHHMGSSGNDVARAVGAKGNSAAFVAGGTNSSLAPYSHLGGYDMLVWKFNH
jgi:hypothetical protein